MKISCRECSGQWTFAICEARMESAKDSVTLSMPVVCNTRLVVVFIERERIRPISDGLVGVAKGRFAAGAVVHI